MSGSLGPLFRRQYLLTREETGAAPSFFRHLSLAAGHLYHCPELSVHQVTGADGRAWTLLGDPLGVGPEAEPVETLRRSTLEDLSAAYDSWGGRWLLLGEDELRTDIGGLVPAFYTDEAVASTPGLLSGGTRPDPPLRHGEPNYWFPAPLSGIPGVRHVLPSQVLRLSDRTVAPRALPAPAGQPVGDLLDEMQAILVAQVRAVRAKRLVLPLTAGRDSRLILAACAAAGVDVLCLTQAHMGMSTADRRIPPQMARRVGYEHVLVGPRGWNRQAGRLYDAQVGGHIAETDRQFMQRGEYRWSEPGDVMLRGVILDGTRDNNHAWLPTGPPTLEGLSEVILPTRVQRDGLQAWLDWVEEDPQPMLWQDRFNLEQEAASWVAMSEVALDLTDARSLPPGNSWAYQRAALSLPLDYRRRSEHHTRLIERMRPELLDFPFNPPENRWLHPGRIPAALRRRARRAMARRR